MRIESDAEHLHEQPAADAVDEVTGPDVAASAEGERRGEFVRGGRQAHLVGEDVGRALGMIPSFAPLPAIPFATSAMVPSPPAATTTRVPERAAARAHAVASPARLVCATSTRTPFCTSTSTTRQSRWGRRRPAMGLAMMSMGAGSSKIWEQKRLE